MIFPRLIIADEYRPGKIPAGVLVAAALKELGYKLRVFMGSVDETTLRLLQLLLNQPVTLLDPVLCDRRETFRWLFQEAASSDALNLVLTSLGGRVSEDAPFIVPQECATLVEWLECDLLPVLYSDASAAIASRTLRELSKHFEDSGIASRRIHTLLFRSVFNLREYELVDLEVGRQLSSVSIGLVPRQYDRDEPLVTDLCAQGAKNALLPIRSAVRQLKDAKNVVEWPVFNALCQTADEWQRQPRVVNQSADSGRINIAVIRDDALTLGGNGTELLFRALGCNIIDIPTEGDVVHGKPLHGVYIPHGLGYMTLTKIFSNLYVRTLISRGMSGDGFMLAEGGSSPLLGDRIRLPYGHSGGGEGRGFGAFGYSSAYLSPMFGAPRKFYALSRKRVNPLLTGSQEWVCGYMSEDLRIEPGEGDDCCWDLFESLKQKEPYATNAYAKGRLLATSMRIEPWSTPETFKRWIEGVG